MPSLPQWYGLLAALDHDVCASVLRLHSFTGSDTVSAFSGRGKLAALKLLMTHDHLWVYLSNLEKSGSSKMKFSRSWKNVHVVSTLLTQKSLMSTRCAMNCSGSPWIRKDMLRVPTIRLPSADPKVASPRVHRLVGGWRWRTSDKLDDRSTSSGCSPGVPLLQMQEVMQAAILPVYGEWIALYSGLYSAGLWKHEGWCLCYARRWIR